MTARCKFAVMAAFLLATVAVLVPPAPATPVAAAEEPFLFPAAPAAPTPAPDTEERPVPQSIFAGTAIGVVLEANNNEVPKNGEEMMKVLAKFGQFAQLPVTFSAVDMKTRLTKPRVIITQKPSFAKLNQFDDKGNPVGGVGPGFPAFPAPAGFGLPPMQAAINTSTLTKPNLEGRLFLAANMERVGGELKVKTFEFISWNSRKQRFDFGFIECDEVEPQIRVVDGVKCFTCHKNKGPILGQGPWSNTPHNDQVRLAIQKAMNPKPVNPAPGVDPIQQFPVMFDSELGQPRRLDTGFSSRNMGVKEPAASKTTFDGVSIQLPQGPAVDAAVRFGADLARDRDVYRAMLRTADGRKGLVVLLGAIAAPGMLEQNSLNVRIALDQTFSTNYPSFANQWVTIHKNSSSTLIDFNPSGSMGSLQLVTTGSPGGGWGGGSTLRQDLRVVWTGDPKLITDYDEKRSDGESRLPSLRQPSNPKAFVRPPIGVPGKPSNAVNAVGLARLIGLTEGDRAFMADRLSNAATRISKPKVTAATLAKEVFSGPHFSDLWTAGEIPDREDFKDRFVKGLNAVLRSHDANEFKFARSDFASGPNVAPVPGKDNKEVPIVATTTCVRCHDVRGVGKPGFNPIPMLAFDPFDKASREHWVKVTPAKLRQPVLARMLKRVSEDRDMPPEDSAEYETFRAKNPAALDAMKEWLDAELKKAKGG